jgi:hypothetical protein
MMRGALAFGPFFARHLGLTWDRFRLSEPATYVVHRDSQHDVHDVRAYAAAVHALIGEAALPDPDVYFGKDLCCELRGWSPAELEAAFDPAIAIAAFDTPERAIDPVELAGSLRAAVEAHPRIEVRLGRMVEAASDEDGKILIASTGKEGPVRNRFDHAVNALWDGRLALNETRGLRAGRRWLHRLKYGVSFQWPSHVSQPGSVTFISGPFGEVVSYQDGLTYLTWYPECLRGMSSDVAPPAWDTYASEPLRSQVVYGTWRALATLVRPLRELEPHELSDACVKGGVILAWGKTDIYDPASELHQRHAIGVTSHGNFHSIDPGKLTMAPLFAQICADRIHGLN